MGFFSKNLNILRFHTSAPFLPHLWFFLVLLVFFVKKERIQEVFLIASNFRPRPSCCSFLQDTFYTFTFTLPNINLPTAQWSSYIGRGWQNCSTKWKCVKLSYFFTFGRWKKIHHVQCVCTPYSFQETVISAKKHKK